MQQPRLELLVPAYCYPVRGSGYWEALADAASSGHRLSVIVNPNSGPGTTLDASYRWAIELLAKTSATLFGYVHTSYGKRPFDDVTNDVRQWRKLYPAVRHIFLDEVPSSATTEAVAYYSQLSEIIRAGDASIQVIGNPGMAMDGRLAKAARFNCVVEYENSDTLPEPGSKFIPTPDPSRAVLLHSARDVTEMVSAVRAIRARGCGLLYVTDRKMPNPWDQLPSYWSQLVLAASGSRY
jgi:hypothetical protein